MSSCTCLRNKSTSTKLLQQISCQEWCDSSPKWCRSCDPYRVESYRAALDVVFGRPETARAHVNSKGKSESQKRKIICQTSKMCWYFVSQVLWNALVKTSNIYHVSTKWGVVHIVQHLQLVDIIDRFGDIQMYLTQNGSFFPPSFRIFVTYLESRVFWGGWSSSLTSP